MQQIHLSSKSWRLNWETRCSGTLCLILPLPYWLWRQSFPTRGGQETTVKNHELETAQIQLVKRSNISYLQIHLENIQPNHILPKTCGTPLGTKKSNSDLTPCYKYSQHNLPGFTLGMQHKSQPLIPKQNVFSTWVISSMWNLPRTSQHPYVRFLYIGAPYGIEIASLHSCW